MDHFSSFTSKNLSAKLHFPTMMRKRLIFTISEVVLCILSYLILHSRWIQSRLFSQIIALFLF